MSKYLLIPNALRTATPPDPWVERLSDRHSHSAGRGDPTKIVFPRT